MNRCLVFTCALLLAFVTVSSTCLAAPSEWIHFTLEPEHRGSAEIKATFRNEAGGRNENNWSSGFKPSELLGLDTSGFRGGATRPLHFAIVREAGRIDCSGNGGGSYAAGYCSMTSNPAFMQLLASRGIGQASREEAFTLIALDVRRELIDAVAASRYPTPTINDLVEMTAVGVDGRYISDLARAGYRPRTVHSLVEFKAIGITPEWIGGFARIGYASLPTDELMQLKALGITPDYVMGFDRVGYRHLPVDTLVQLKALDITPEFVRDTVGERGAMPPVGDLVQMKIFGRKH